MMKIFLILPAISVLYFSCTKNTPTSRQSPAPKINSFIANPGTINQGESSTLTWSVVGATSFTINGETVADSSKIVTPRTSEEYTLVATNLSGSVNAKTTVTVNIPPPPKDTLASGWKKIEGISSDGTFNDIFFINNTGFAIGSLGILKSSDGGDTWSGLIIPSGVNSPFNMGMGNETNAIFVFGQGQLVSTRDGGITFTVSTLPDVISDVFFVDATTAYAAGTNIWKTTDAGSNWVKLYSFPSEGYTALYFLNAQIGWASHTNGLYKTVNAGVDWSLICAQFDYTPVIFFSNSDTGYITYFLRGYGSGPALARTMDGWATWATAFGGSGRSYDVHFVSDKTGYVTDDTRIYKTEDGGNTWISEVHLVSNMLIELHFTDPDHGWACGSEGTILKYNR